MEIENFRINVFPGNEILDCHIHGGEDYKTVVGRVVRSRSDHTRLGIKNLSGRSWRVKHPYGVTEEVTPDKIAVTQLGMEIEFEPGVSAQIVE